MAMIAGANSFATTYFNNLSSNQLNKVLFSYLSLIGPLFLFNLFSYFLLTNYWGQGRSLGAVFCDIETRGKHFKEITFSSSITKSFIQTFYFITIFTGPFSLLLFLFPLLREDQRGLSSILSSTDFWEQGRLETTLPAIVKTSENELDNVLTLPTGPTILMEPGSSKKKAA